MPILGVFRSIVRHAQHIADKRIDGDLEHLKKCMRKRRTYTKRQIRQNVIKLYEIESLLRDVCLNKCTVPKLRALLNLTNNELSEKNQGSNVILWNQQEERRFDILSLQPKHKLKEVDRRAKFAVAAGEFATRCNVKRTPENKIALETIFTPFFKHHPKPAPTKPFKVVLLSVKRNAGSLPILRVNGVPRRPSGFKRHIVEVDTDYYSKFEKLQDQINLAKQYSSSFDGEDMTEWIKHLQNELKRQKMKLMQYTNKLEVQRRILLQRQKKMQIYWDYKFRLKQQSLKRKPKEPKLTLDTL